MARCNCGAATCSCSYSPGCGISMSGVGTAGNPYVFSADLDAAGGLVCNSEGIAIERVRVGTSTERAALGVGSVHDGDQWTESDTGLRYERLGSSWILAGDLTGYTTFTPTIYSTTTTFLGIGNGTVYGRYFRSGRHVHVHMGFTWGSTSATGGLTGAVRLSLPFAPQSDFAVDRAPLGNGRIIDISTLYTPRHAGYRDVTGTHTAALFNDAGTETTFATIATWATGDDVKFNLLYETAS